MRKKKVLLSMITVIGISFLGLGTIGAQSLQATVGSYDLIVPGSATSHPTVFSGRIAKDSTSTNGEENNSSIGGGKTLNSAFYYGNQQVSPQVSVSSGSNVIHQYYSGDNRDDRNIRLGQSTKVTTVVDVESSGTWSPDSTN